MADRGNGTEPACVCPKCGHDDIAMSFHPRRSFCDPYSTYTFSSQDGEHLHYSCRRCRYDWTGATVDGERQSSPPLDEADYRRAASDMQEKLDD